MQRKSHLKFLGILVFCVVQLLLWASCAPAPTPVPIQQTATALQSSFNSQALMGTQQALFTTSQAFGGQPFLIVTAGIPFTIPPPSTLQALTAQPCTFQWVTQDLPEVTSAAQTAFAQHPLLADVNVRAQVFGENCLDPDGSVRYFQPMTTDFFLMTTIDSLGDLEAVAQIALEATETLSAPMNVQLPAKLGYLDMTLIADNSMGHLRTTFDQIAFSRVQGWTGGALIDSLGGVVQR